MKSVLHDIEEIMARADLDGWDKCGEEELDSPCDSPSNLLNLVSDICQAVLVCESRDDRRKVTAKVDE